MKQLQNCMRASIFFKAQALGSQTRAPSLYEMENTSIRVPDSKYILQTPCTWKYIKVFIAGKKFTFAIIIKQYRYIFPTSLVRRPASDRYQCPVKRIQLEFFFTGVNAMADELF